MPSLGADMDAGTLLEWKVAVGDHVTKGSIVGLVETQKATMEIESFSDGVVDALLVSPGATVPVGQPLARLRGAGEQPSARAPVPTPAPAPAPAVEERVRSSPAARQRARDLGVDLHTVHGTGP
ncbi:MAG: biotin/lipoyl-containing protein, partial [Acidobacteriota bacterium]